MKTLVLDQIHQSALDYGQDKLDIVAWDTAKIEDHYAEAEAVIVRTFKMTPKVIDQMPNLKIIAKHGVGVDNIDIDYAKSKNIVVTNTPQANMNSVAELVITLALACARKVVDAHNRVLGGIEKNSPLDLQGMELRGKTLGLIGLGKIGSTVGNIFKNAFDTEVLVFDKFLPKKKCESLGFTYCESLEDLLKSSHIVSISVPLTPETENMIARDQLELMRDDAILINTSRGKIINEADLYDHLQAHKMFGAAIDAFAVEPVAKDNPLLSCQNFIATPHNGANTEEALIRMGTEAIDEIVRVKNGEANLNSL